MKKLKESKLIQSLQVTFSKPDGNLDRSKSMEQELKEKYIDSADRIAKLVIEKQEAYGDSFGKSGQIVNILYPDGIPVEKLDDALTLIRILDKMFRIATDKDALGESPFRDIMGYALLAVVRDERKSK